MQVSDWRQQFAKRVDVLRESAAKAFDRFADQTVDAVYEEFAAFTSQHDFHCAAPQHQQGARFYKFALSEDAYVLMIFRSRGIDSVECEHQCSAPGRGCAKGEKASIQIAEAGREWVEACFQAALDDLVARVSDACLKEQPRELVGV